MHGVDAEQAVVRELREANEKFPSFNSRHEGYAVIKEELDELWDDIKNKDAHPDDITAECVQVAAMAIRFLADLC